MFRLTVEDSTEEPEASGPSAEYEFARRRIYSNTKDFWRYIIFKLNELENLVDDSYTRDFPRIRETVGENYRFLLNDISRLGRADSHSEWRRERSDNLSDIVQTRLRELQNPRDCNGARKLVCNSTLVSSAPRRGRTTI